VSLHPRTKKEHDEAVYSILITPASLPPTMPYCRFRPTCKVVQLPLAGPNHLLAFASHNTTRVSVLRKSILSSSTFMKSIGASASPLSSELSQVSVPCRVKRATQRSSSARHMLWPQDQDHRLEIGIRRLPSSPDQQSIRRDEARIHPDHSTPSSLVKQIICRLSSGPGHEATVSPSSPPYSHASTSLECLSSITPPNQAARNHHSPTIHIQYQASLTTISIDTLPPGEDTSSSITNSHLIN